MGHNDIEPVKDLDGLARALKNNIMHNAAFYHRVFGLGAEPDIYADKEFKAFMAVFGKDANVIFAGDWSIHTIPVDILPRDGFFVHACPGAAMEQLTSAFDIKDSWPCWRYRAPDNFGPGPWDELDHLVPDDATFIADYWDLIDDPEDILREKITKYDSVCVRIGGKPVSWVGIHFEAVGIAELGFAHTLDAHRRKGYSAMCTKALVNKLSMQGSRALAHMFKDNIASIALAESMGFERMGEATWAQVGERVQGVY